VLFVPPFAEEMNKCRRMFTEAANALAQHGWASVVPDLSGTGDSAGDFGDATWRTWQSDLSIVAAWSAALGFPVTRLVATRLGCALAAMSSDLPALSSVRRTTFWQPVLDGGRYLGQFLRLRMAAGLLDEGKETVSELRERLRRGESLNVAGYMLTADLASELEAIDAARALSPRLGSIQWLEVVRDEAAGLPPASSRILHAAKDHGVSVEPHVVGGEPFWASTEIVVNASVVDRTVSYLVQSA
jgi:exosortase A-associated hydrolase 2